MPINSFAVWQCSDRRITVFERGKATEILDNESIKHVSVVCTDGTALVAYSGLGYTLDRKQHVSEWVADSLVGEPYGLRDLLTRVREAATTDFGQALARHGVRHDFWIGGFQGTGEDNDPKPWYAQISNHRPDTTVQPGFEVRAMMATAPLVAGGGQLKAVLPEDWRQIRQAISSNPRPEDMCQLLAFANRRAAEGGRPGAALVSRECVSAYLLPKNNIHAARIFHWQNRPVEQSALPAVVFGRAATTHDEWAQLWRTMLEIRFRTPEAEQEFERVMAKEEARMLQEMGPGRRRIHRPHRRPPRHKNRR